MPQNMLYCAAALKGKTCTDKTCSKSHDYIRCEPCKLRLHINSFKDHTSGKKHLQKLASLGLPKTSVPQPAPSSQAASSNLRPGPLANTPPASNNNTSTKDPVPLVTGSGRTHNKIPYCSTTLQGETCTDSRCQYQHDTIRCEPCGRSFPAPLFNQHQSSNSHLLNVASNGSTNPSTSLRPSPPQPATSNSQPIHPQISAPPATARGSPSTPATNPHVTVSHEDGLDFVAGGSGTVADPIFPSVNDTISIEATSPLSNLSVVSMKLAPSPNPWFGAYLLGKTVVVQQNSPRKVLVSFEATHAGTFHATLEIIFGDKTRPNDQRFSVTRELRGCATLPGGQASSRAPSNAMGGDTIGCDSAGISVSHESGLQFSVERSRPGETFVKQTKVLVFTKSFGTTMVSFKGTRICSFDGSVDTFSAQLEGACTWSNNPQRRVIVSFLPQREGVYGALLEVTLLDQIRQRDFVVKRMLEGWATQPIDEPNDEKRESSPSPSTRSQPINGHVNDHARVPPFKEEELLDSDGTGISVSHARGLDFGIVERKRPNGPFPSPSSFFTIKHADGFPAVTFVKEKTRTIDGGDPEFEAVFEGDSLNIQPGTESTVRVIFSPKFEGLFKATLELVFYHNQLSAWFVVRRMLRGIAGSLEDHKQLGSLDQEDDDEPIERHRERPPRKIILLSPPDWLRKSRHIPDYEVPAIVQQAVDNSTETHPYYQNAPDLVSALRPGSLNMNTYAHYFASLLSVEDGHQMYARSRRWDVWCQPEQDDNVYRCRQRYSVEIENNDEDLLPEVVLGDFLWLDDVQDYIRYEARVIKIDVFARRHLAVLKMSLRLPADFNLHRGTQFILQLRHNRTNLRYQYHTLTASFASPRRLLFPSVSDIKPKRHLSRIEIYNLKFRHLVNRTIRDDPQQLQGIVSVLEQPKGSVPFIIYGPPGTGKTSTIVECIVQLVRRDASVRVLACTPSSASADLLAERLAAAGLDSDKLYHLNASSIYEDSICDDEQALTHTGIPGHERLLAFRVLLSTCSNAAILQTLDIPVGHFSHIVIDEATQAEEPLAMIPIMTFSNTSTNIILAGDPNQLGPIIQSPTAAASGLGTSYFQRLITMCDVYGLDTQVGNTIIVLRRNWRSHGAIIAWSNRYLYEDMMRDHGNAYITYHMVNSDVLPRKGFPVIFHGMRGNEEHTSSSPTCFNVLEASIIRDYCVRLTRDPERKIYPEEIGVLAPYKTQVRAIRQLLKAAKQSDISVGSVEHFQGQERKVIILATTRSNEESHPRKSSGLLANHARMNVAITRAQALLIVIGDPGVLGMYEHWRTFLKYVESRKGWIGRMHNMGSEEVIPPLGYEIIPRKGGIAYGEEFIDGKSEKIYRTSRGQSERQDDNENSHDAVSCTSSDSVRRNTI